MTAVILPFIRPAMHGLANPAAACAINVIEYHEARRWAVGLGKGWGVEPTTDGPGMALSIRTPRCAAPANEEDGPAMPWVLARSEEGVVVLEDGWLERGTFPSVTAALACVLAVEARMAAAFTDR